MTILDLPDLLSLLDADERSSRQAVAALVRSGSRFVPELIQALENPDAMTVNNTDKIVLVLGKIGDRSAIEPITTQLIGGRMDGGPSACPYESARALVRLKAFD